MHQHNVTNRIAVLDFLRGISVLGILILNIENFVFPRSFSPYLFGFDAEIDQQVRFWVYFLFQGKFFTMFSILFGVSFYLMLERFSQRYDGLTAVDIYARRLLVLFFIGIAHAYLIWDGDILHHYAICALFLFPLRSFGQKQLLLVIALLFGTMLFNSYQKTTETAELYQSYQQAILLAEDERSSEQQRSVNRWQRRTSEREPSYFQGDVKVRQAGYWENLLENLDSNQVIKGELFFQNIFFNTLLMMLIGVVLYRSGIFHNYRCWSYYWLITCSFLLTGLAMGYLRYSHWSFDYLNPNTDVLKGLVFTTAFVVQGVSYLLLLNGIYQVIKSPKYLDWLNNIGRMALSNYLLQSLVCAFIFYGYGLGLVDQFSRSELLWVVPLVWMANIGFTQVWLAYRAQGPMEQLWRKWSMPAFAAEVTDTEPLNHARTK